MAEPSLIWFREHPKEPAHWPALANSLQSFETSLALLPIGRYPAALISCASAIESALHLWCPKHDKLHALLDVYKKEFPETVAPSWALDDFRRLRNKFAHKGSSPDDDEDSVILLLSTGYLFLDACYKNLFNVSLLPATPSTLGCLERNLARHLRIATDTCTKLLEAGRRKPCCINALASYIGLSVQLWVTPEWELDLAQGDGRDGQGVWDRKQQRREQVERIYQDSFELTCPVCFEPSLICKLDEAALDNEDIKVERGFCINCNFAFPNDCIELFTALCGDEFNELVPALRNRYGLS